MINQLILVKIIVALPIISVILTVYCVKIYKRHKKISWIIALIPFVIYVFLFVPVTIKSAINRFGNLKLSSLIAVIQSYYQGTENFFWAYCILSLTLPFVALLIHSFFKKLDKLDEEDELEKLEKIKLDNTWEDT